MNRAPPSSITAVGPPTSRTDARCGGSPGGALGAGRPVTTAHAASERNEKKVAQGK
jgi:hypothetical protein